MHIKVLQLLFSAVLFLTATTGVDAQSNSRRTVVAGEEVRYSAPGGVTCIGYIARPEGATAALPVVLVIHEWWGHNGYARMRADKLAQLGYFAFAVDMYGNGKEGPTPAEASALATPFYKDPALAQERIQAAINKLADFKEANNQKIAAIGYCFGGSMVLNAAKLGMPLLGVVSFHGGLAGVPAEAGKTTAAILVCHGAADSFISAEELEGFRKNLDDTKTSYSFISYPDATHAFTNPEATANGKKFNLPIAYNKVADAKSWEDMKLFLANLFK